MSEQIKAIEQDVKIELELKMPIRIKEIKKWLTNNREQWEEGLIRSFEKLFQARREKEIE